MSRQTRLSGRTKKKFLWKQNLKRGVLLWDAGTLTIFIFFFFYFSDFILIFLFLFFIFLLDDEEACDTIVT